MILLYYWQAWVEITIPNPCPKSPKNEIKEEKNQGGQQDESKEMGFSIMSNEKIIKVTWVSKSLSESE